jgi:hypothetical protein
MRADGPTTEVCVRNVSARGMLLQACRPPAPGSYVEIMLPETSLAARVVWASERRFGVSTRERIPLADFIGPMARQDGCAALKTARKARAAARSAQRGAGGRTASRSLQFGFLRLCGAAAAAAAASIAHGALAGVRDSLISAL